MEFKDFFCGKNDSGRRLDKVASRIFESSGISAGVFSLIRKSLVRVNDRKSTGDYRVREGDKISIAKFLFNNAEKNSFTAENFPTERTCVKNREIPIDLKAITLFRNEHLLILNKPAGINVQPSKDCKFCLSDLVVEDYKNSRKTSLSFRPGPLHRIDRWTSGLVAFSQSLEGARWFTENIESHRILKTYLGITEGNYASKTEKYVDLIEIPKIQSQKQNEGYSTVLIGNPNGKKAVTTAEFLKKMEIDVTQCNLVKFYIETGRKHQIRAQSSFHGHPLFGDTAYGGKKSRENRFYLHAWKLEFPENPIGLPEEICAPCNFLDSGTNS